MMGREIRPRAQTMPRDITAPEVWATLGGIRIPNLLIRRAIPIVQPIALCPSASSDLVVHNFFYSGPSSH